MSAARARTWTAQPGVDHTSHEPLCFQLSTQYLKRLWQHCLGFKWLPRKTQQKFEELVGWVAILFNVLGNANRLYALAVSGKALLLLLLLLAKLKREVNIYHRLMWYVLITFYLLLLVLEIDLCADSPCENNATCQNFKTYYTCTCLAGFQGVNCETGIK